MGFAVLRRVRWRNVGRTVGTVALVAAVVAWPRLQRPAPQVPGSEATPLATPRAAPRAEEVPSPRERRRVGRRRDGRGRRATRGRRAEGPPRAATPGPGVRPRTGETPRLGETPGAVAPPPPLDPAQTEFGFEGG